MDDASDLCGCATAKLKAILFDRAKSNLAQAGVGDRVQFVASDFFQSVPSGADAYFLRQIIHDWDDDQSRTILKNFHAAMPSDSRLLLVAFVLPDGSDLFHGKWFDQSNNTMAFSVSITSTSVAHDNATAELRRHQRQARSVRLTGRIVVDDVDWIMAVRTANVHGGGWVLLPVCLLGGGHGTAGRARVPTLQS